MKNLGNVTPKGKQEAIQYFEDLYGKILSADGNFLEYNIPYSKVEFLQFLAKNKNLLFHGSNYDLNELAPRQANCKSKKFGNLNAVYATQDAVLPVFYAIKDKGKFIGVADSGYSDETLDDTESVKYHFEVEPGLLKISPWSPGVIYILPRDKFEQGVDDEGGMIDEWISKEPVKPLAKLRVNPADFPYLKEIQPIKN